MGMPHAGSAFQRIQRFLATVCKTVPLCYQTVVLSCHVCLSLTYVCSGQTVAWIKMKHDMQDAGRPLFTPHCVRWGPSFPQKGYNPPFSVHTRCDQTARWIKMPLGREVGLGPCHIVLDGDPVPSPPPKKKVAEPPPIFGPCLLWPNG